MTILAGQRLKASDMQLAITPPTCQARGTTGQSIPNNVATSITLDTEDFDNNGMHSVAANTSRMTCVTAGWYEVSANIPYTANATGAREIRLILNGSTLVPGGRISILAGSGTVGQSVGLPTMMVQLSAGDFLEIQGFQTSGGALTLNAVNGLFATMCVRWVSP